MFVFTALWWFKYKNKQHFLKMQKILRTLLEINFLWIAWNVFKTQTTALYLAHGKKHLKNSYYIRINIAKLIRFLQISQEESVIQSFVSLSKYTRHYVCMYLHSMWYESWRSKCMQKNKVISLHLYRCRYICNCSSNKIIVL